MTREDVSPTKIRAGASKESNGTEGASVCAHNNRDPAATCVPSPWSDSISLCQWMGMRAEELDRLAGPSRAQRHVSQVPASAPE